MVPGIGAQGGNLKEVVKFGTDYQGMSTLINSSRTILYASNGFDFADAARERTKHLRDQINMHISIHKNPGLLDKN